MKRAAKHDDDLKQIKVAGLSGPNGRAWQVAEPQAKARNRLKSLNIPTPSVILNHL